MTQLLWDGDAWINGNLGLLHDDPQAPLHVEQYAAGELARFMRSSHGGLRIEPDEAGAGIQGLGSDLTPGSLAINSAGGDVTLGTIASKTRVRGELQVDGKLTVAGRDITVDGSKLDSHLAATNNPHAVTAAQVGALALGGGTLTGVLTVQGDLTTTGTVNAREVAADGAKLDTHLAATNNPHGVTAAQVGALALVGGTLTGALTVQGNLTTTGTGSINGRDVAADGGKLDTTWPPMIIRMV